MLILVARFVHRIWELKFSGDVSPRNRTMPRFMPSFQPSDRRLVILVGLGPPSNILQRFLLRSKTRLDCPPTEQPHQVIQCSNPSPDLPVTLTKDLPA